MVKSVEVLGYEKMSPVDKDNQSFSVNVQFVVQRSGLPKPESMLTQIQSDDHSDDHISKKKHTDAIDEQFSEIQIQDMAQEKYTDQKVKEVVKTQQKALKEAAASDDSDKSTTAVRSLLSNGSLGSNATANGSLNLSEAEQEANHLAQSL